MTFTVTITVGRQPERDRFGDPVGGPVLHTIDGCTPYPTGSTEVENRSDSVTTGQGVLAPYGSDIKAADFVWLDGDDLTARAPWKVTGEPGPYRSPFTGWTPGIEIHLDRYDG